MSALESTFRATDTYLNMVLSYPGISPNAVLVLFLLTLFRIIPIIVLAPFLGGKSLPNAAKMMFGIALSAIFIPNVLVHATKTLDFNMIFLVYAIKEVVFGFALGFLVSVPFYIAMTSGNLIDHIRGASSLQITDPSTQTQTSRLGLLYNYVLIAVFFMIGGPMYFFQAMASSFEIIPVDSYFNPAFFAGNVPFWKAMTHILYRIMSLALQLAAPSLIGILMTEMFLGIANRLAPQVQIVFLGIPLKSWVGLMLLALAWVFILDQLGKESLSWIRMMEILLQKMGLYHAS
ncbi:MAG: flagellar biosynthetic protein FliR [Chlamydiota bacterium]